MEDAMFQEAVANMRWMTFRDLVKPLCCREKLRPKHWQRALFDYFECECGVTPEDRALIERVITEMMNESRSWCNPQVFDEAGARTALRKAFDTILAAQDSTGTSGSLPQPVEMATRTAELARELCV